MNTTSMLLRTSFYWLLLCFALPASASGQTVITNGFINFIDLSFNNVDHNNPKWLVQINDQSSGNVYDPIPPSSMVDPFVFDKPGGARFRIAGPEHLFTRPASSAWTFIGVAGGELFRATPQSGDPTTRLIMGISTLGISNNVFVNNQLNITMSVANVTNPGDFSYYRNDGVSNDALGVLFPPPLFSTVDNITTLTRDAGTLNDFNMAFSHPGIYNIDFQFSGTRTAAAGGGTVTSAVYRYTFDVAAVPEPATWGLLGLSACSLVGYALLARRRQKRLLEESIPE